MTLQKFGIEAIYIPHAKHGYDLNEAHVKKLFADYNLDFEFVSDGDPSTFTDELLNNYFIPEIKSIIRLGSISLNLNHICSYQRMISSKNKFALIFEDDPFFLGNFIKKIELVAKEAESLPPGFIISLENTTLEFPHRSVVKKDKYLYPAKQERCTGAYLIDLKAAQGILIDLQTNKCSTAVDVWHNNMVDRGVIKIYWAHPPLVEQGSHNGLMSSTISSKQKNVFRRIKWLAQKYYKMYIWRWIKSE